MYFTFSISLSTQSISSHHTPFTILKANTINDDFVNALQDTGHKISEGDFDGLGGLGIDDGITNSDWKIYILGCASAVGIVEFLVLWRYKQ